MVSIPPSDIGSGLSSLDEDGSYITGWETEPIVRVEYALVSPVPDDGARPRSPEFIKGSTSNAVDDDGYIYRPQDVDPLRVDGSREPVACPSRARRLDSP